MSRPAILCVILVAVTVSLVGCTQAPVLTSIQVIPNTASLTTVGETIQFKAIGSYQRSGGHPTVLTDITSQAVWASTDVSVSTISSSGLATAASSGSTTITASMGGAVGSSTLAVSAVAVHDLTSIAIIPAQQIVTSVGEPAQFLAIGTYTTGPITLDLTDQVTWQSSDVSVATINSAGLALGNAPGTTTITATGKSNTGAAIAGSSTLTVNTILGPVTLPLLSLYEVGLGSGTVTSNPVGINCTSATGAGCTGNFVLGSSVVLTATPAAGSTFGGWSANCQAAATNPPPTTCTVIMNNDEPVGAIFN